MKKTVFVLLLMVTLVVAVPAAAKAKDPVGERINVWTGNPSTFPSNQPFHIAHGWGFSPPEENPHSKYEFWLEVDNKRVGADFIKRSGGGDPDLITWFWVHNFPDGMTGTHTFTGHWIAPCKYAELEGAPPGACPSKKGQFEAYTRTLTVTFTP